MPIPNDSHYNYWCHVHSTRQDNARDSAAGSSAAISAGRDAKPDTTQTTIAIVPSFAVAHGPHYCRIRKATGQCRCLPVLYRSLAFGNYWQRRGFLENLKKQLTSAAAWRYWPRCLASSLGRRLREAPSLTAGEVGPNQSRSFP
jgi:hypothetical protein